MKTINQNEEIDEILAFLSSIYPLSDKCRKYIKDVIKRKVVRNKEALLKIGEVNQFLYFIKNGSLRCFYYHKNEEVSRWFFFENETVVSIGSFYDQVPSQDCIEAVKEAVVYYIEKKDFDYLIMTFHEFAIIACVLLIKYLKIFEEHSTLIRKQSPIESSQQVLSKMPMVFQRIPRKYIASWLNMDPATLSRKRKGRAK